MISDLFVMTCNVHLSSIIDIEIEDNFIENIFQITESLAYRLIK